jgi:Mg-chelatase subunit ChlD
MNFLNEQAWLWLPLALSGALMAWLAYGKQKLMLIAWGTAVNADRYGRRIGARAFIAKGILALLALVAGFAALARPAIESKHVEFPAGSVDVVTLFDVSRSMAARDCNGATRLNMARTILKDEIIPSLDRNQLGVIAYAGQATPVVYLTGELDTVTWLASHELKISSAPGQGSAMGGAFELAFKYFDHDSAPPRRKMIILLSDGGTDDDSNLEEIVSGCRKRDLTLIVVGLGTPQPALIPMEELSEEDRRLAIDQFYKIDGKPALTSLDVATLSQLTRAVGETATFLQVSKPGQFHFQPLASQMSPKEKVGIKELYFYPCLAFLILISLTPLVTAVRVRSVRKPLEPVPAKHTAR